MSALGSLTKNLPKNACPARKESEMSALIGQAWLSSNYSLNLGFKKKEQHRHEKCCTFLRSYVCVFDGNLTRAFEFLFRWKSIQKHNLSWWVVDLQTGVDDRLREIKTMFCKSIHFPPTTRVPWASASVSRFGRAFELKGASLPSSWQAERSLRW